MTKPPSAPRLILGVPFHVGTLDQLLARTLEGGLIVVPSAPVLADLSADPAHREALEQSDLALTDSGFFVVLWLLLKGERLPRISGLRYLRALLKLPAFRAPGATFWVMPSADDSAANQAWLAGQGIPVSDSDCYAAPRYSPSGPLSDPALLARLESRRPSFVVLCIAGGVQERLGHHLRQNLTYRPAILCTGAAIAFLSGRQVGIPVWADRIFLGWLFRTLHDPRRYLPRYRKALKLVPMVLRARR